MVLREDIWTHDTCLVCQSMHSTEAEKERHEQEDIHKSKTVVYDFLSGELSCLTASDKQSLLYQRYYRANAAIAGLDCICELNFSWSEVPFWACTICYVAGKTMESADEHMYSSFHKRNYIAEYHPDRYATLLRVKEKSSGNKQSLLEHEAILEILNMSEGLIRPDVYEFNERDREWAFQKLGLTEGESPPSYIIEEISDNHQIALCLVCGETFMAYTKEDLLRQAWFTHLSTSIHQRCKFMLSLLQEDKLTECEGSPPGCQARQENKFVKKANDDDDTFSPSYGPTVGLEFLIMFTDTDESFCQLCFCCFQNTTIADHFSSEYHIERFMKRSSPAKLLNSEYLKIEERIDILTFFYEENPITVHKYYRSDKQLPLLLKNYQLPERRSVIAYDMKQFDLGHNIVAIWCEDCKEYIHINDAEAWNIHIFDDPHFEHATRKFLHYLGDEGMVRSNSRLDDFPRSDPPTWEDQYSISLGVLTTQDHCEYGLQFIVSDKLKKKLLCTCCFLECDDGDAQMFSFHARSLQHITRAMHSLNKKTMITLSFRFPDQNNRKPLLLDYLRHCKMNGRDKQQGISVYDPVMACKLNCIGSTFSGIPKYLLDLANIAPENRKNFLKESAENGVNEKIRIVPLNTALRLCKIEVKVWEKDSMIFHCEECGQSFSTTQSQVEEFLTEHLLSTAHWERTKILNENSLNENCRLATKVSKIAVPTFQQPATKKVTWKWNDKKATYEFVYAQLGLRDICERRNFREAPKPDMFCTNCAQSFKANRLDLEQHIRSFSHIFYYMQKYQPNIIPELQTELMNNELSIVERHKSIRRLFSRASKGYEKRKPDDIPIYDFEERECEYADVKRALAEDAEQFAGRIPPSQQRSVTNIFDPSAENQQHVLDLTAVRMYGRGQAQKKLEDLFKQYEFIIEAEERDKQNETILKDDGTAIRLEKAKRDLLAVVHFDGLVETADQQQQSAAAKGSGPATNPTISSYVTVPKPPNHDRRSESRPDKHAHHSRRSRRSKSKTRSKSRSRKSRSRTRSPTRHSRHHSRSPAGRRTDRSKSVHRRHPSSSRSPKRRSRSPQLSSIRARSRTRLPTMAARQPSRERGKSKTPATVTPPPERQHQSIVYTSYAKRLADLKASLLAKGGSKRILTDDPSLFVFQQNNKKHIDKTKVTEYIAKEAATTSTKPKPVPNEHRRTTYGSNNEEVGGFFQYIPPPPPGYTQKYIGGAYDPSYLEKMYPHLLRNDVSPPRGNLDDLTSERILKANNLSPAKSSQHATTSTQKTTSYKRSKSKSRSPAEERRSKRSRSRSTDGRKKRKSGHDEDKSDDDDKSSGGESSSSSDAVESASKKQKLLNRLMNEKRKEMAKKIQMRIPRELPDVPAFRAQALRRKKTQKKAEKQQRLNDSMVKLEEEEVENMEAISPGPEDISMIDDDSSSEKQPTETTFPVAGSAQKSAAAAATPWTTAALAAQKINRHNRWDETPKSRFILVDGKFVSADLAPQQTTTSESGGHETGGQQIPTSLDHPNVHQLAQNVLTQMAASTSVLTAKQLLSAAAAATTTIPATRITIPPPPVNSTLGQQGILPTPTPITATAPLTGANPLPASLLGTLTSALGVRPAIPPPQLNLPPPSLMMPPPQFHQPPPIVDRAGLYMHTKMQYYATALDRVNNIKDLIEFMWREGYDPIPQTDPPLLFNDVLRKQRGLIGANTLYQIICYGHPELETYYCGMCNHWTTVSEMFMHLRAPMHLLNYMFRNYKMYHRKAMSEQDEQARDVLLQRFAHKIWEVEKCGQCTHRMRCILNEEAIRRIWPDYINCIDNSWKIMDDDDIEFLNASGPTTTTNMGADQQGTSSRPNSLPRQQSAEMAPPTPHQFMDPESIRAASVSVRASIVAKKLEMGERAGIPPPGLVQIKSERKEEEEQEQSHERSEKKQREGRSEKRSERKRSRSPRKSRSKARTHRSRSKTPAASSKSAHDRGDKEKEREKDDGQRRRSKSRGGRSKRNRPSKQARDTNDRKKSDQNETTTTTTEPVDLAERMAHFLHKIGDSGNASRLYWQKLNDEEQQSQSTSMAPPPPAGVPPPEHIACASTSSSSSVKIVHESLADRIAGSGDAILRRHLRDEAERVHFSPERPAVTPLNHVPTTNKQGQSSAKVAERERDMEGQKQTKRAIGAMVELQQEYTRNGGYLSAEVFFDTCQEFGITPDEVMKNEMLCGAASAFHVNVHAAYAAMAQRMQQQRMQGPLATAPGPSHQQQGGDQHVHPQQMARPQPQVQQLQAEMGQPSDNQQRFNLQSMGVDPSKLRSLDPRMLQTILDKATATGGAGMPQHQRGPSHSRFELHDIRLDESLAPGNYVYPSYEEMEEQQAASSRADIDSNISKLTFAFSQPPANPAAPQTDTSAEFTLAVQASMRQKQQHFGQGLAGGLPKHPQAYVRGPPQPLLPPPHLRGPQPPPGPPSDVREMPMDFTGDIDIAPSWRTPPQQRQQAGGGPIGPGNSPAQQQQMPMRPLQQYSMPPSQRGGPADQSPMHPPYPRFPQQPRNTPPRLVTPVSGTPPRPPPPPGSTQQSPQQQQQGGGGGTPRAQQKQMDPNLQRLAMEVGDDWNSLGQFSLDSLFGIGTSGAQEKNGGDGQQQRK